MSDTKKELQVFGYILESTNRTEILEYLSEELFSKGLVDDKYKDAVLKREKEYPTGVPCQPFSIAMPHAERENVYENAIIVTKLLKGAPFHRMDKPEDTISVKLIFMLAINSNDQELEIITQIMDIIQEQSIINNLVNARSESEIEHYITDYMSKSNQKNN